MLFVSDHRLIMNTPVSLVHDLHLKISFACWNKNRESAHNQCSLSVSNNPKTTFSHIVSNKVIRPL